MILGWEDPLEKDRLPTPIFLGFPSGSDSKESPAMWETWVQFLGWEGGGHGNPFQYSCLENPLDSEAWRVTVHGAAHSPMRLSAAEQSKRNGPPLGLAET